MSQNQFSATELLTYANLQIAAEALYSKRRVGNFEALRFLMNFQAA